MSYSIRPMPTFQKQFKKLLKRYKSLINDINELQVILMENPTQGTPLGKDCYKIRMGLFRVKTRANQGVHGL